MKKLFLVLTTVFLTCFTYQSTNAHASVETKVAPGKELIGGAYLVFAGKHGGELTAKDIAETKALIVAGCAQGSLIYQFDLKVTRNGKTTTFYGDSDQLTAAMHSELKRLSTGDKFTFKNTKARLPKEGTVDVWAKVFTVV